MGESNKKRFAVHLRADDIEYVKKVHGGSLKVFMAFLEEEGEVWDVYRVAKGELPAEDAVEIYDGFVVTGSCSDAYGDDLWIQNLVALLRRLHQLRRKVVGVCFGHQKQLQHSSYTYRFSNSLLDQLQQL